MNKIMSIFIVMLASRIFLVAENNTKKDYEQIISSFSTYRYSKAKILKIGKSGTYLEPTLARLFSLGEQDPNKEALKKISNISNLESLYSDGDFAAIKVKLDAALNEEGRDISLEALSETTSDGFVRLKVVYDEYIASNPTSNIISKLTQQFKSDLELLDMFKFVAIKSRPMINYYHLFAITRNDNSNLDLDNNLYGLALITVSDEVADVKLPSVDEVLINGTPSNEGTLKIITNKNRLVYLNKEKDNPFSDKDDKLYKEVKDLFANVYKEENGEYFNTVGGKKYKILGKDPNSQSYYVDYFALISNVFLQEDYKDVSFEAKGFGGKNRFFAPSFGVTVPMVKGFFPSDPDIQKYRMISEGIATKAKRNFNELIVSPDQIRWIKYKESVGKVYVYSSKELEAIKSTILAPGSDSSKVINFMYSLGTSIYINKAEAETNFKEVFAASGLKLVDGQKVQDLIKAMVIDTTVFGYGVATTNLPEIGFELKTGADEIGYTSFYTGKTSLSVLWKNSQLGLILPTNGLSNIMNDAYGYNLDNGKGTNFTYGSFGLYSKFDFTLPILPQTEVFNLEASYLFGDAQFSNFGGKITTADDDYTSASYAAKFGNYREFITRYTAALHYTFGFAIDDDFQFRVGVGAASYAVETWNNEVQRKAINETDTVNALKFRKFDTESIGGLSLKLEFLSSSPTTPYGARLQYFDNNLIASTWLQVGVAEDFYLKLTASGFTSSLKNAKRNWELDSYFVPNIKLIYYF